MYLCWHCRTEPVTVRVALHEPLVSFERLELCEACCCRWLFAVAGPAVGVNPRLILTRKVLTTVRRP